MPAVLDETLPEIVRLLRDKAGLAPESVGGASLAHAVRSRMAACETDIPQDYLRRLLLDAAELQELLEQLVVPETWFFRDALAFRSLASGLEALRRCAQGVVRALSIACSTGEEVYSLAIALRQSGFAPSQVSILGIDLSRRALAAAREGVFAARSFREPDPLLGVPCDRWFQQTGDVWRVRDELRAGIEFRWGNLAQAEFLPDEPPFHLVFCRNLLIYFHDDARRLAVRHLHRLLRRDGLLYSTPAEARVLGEAGFRSLGSQCPFAFCRSHRLAETPPLAPVVRPAERASVTSPPGAAVPTPHRPSPVRPRTAESAAGAPPPAPLSAASVLRCDAARPSALQAAREAADCGRLEEADALCGQALAEDPASAESHYIRGLVRQARQELAEAQRCFEKALYLDPKHYQALVHLMLLAEQCGDPQAAANYRRRALQVAPQEAS